MKRIGLRWHQGDANLHCFPSPPLTRKLPNGASSQKVTISPRKRSRIGTNISIFLIKYWKVWEASVML